MGSIHHVNGIPIDFDHATYNKCLHSIAPTPKDSEKVQEIFLSMYLDAQYELFRRFRPEIVGHMDLCRLYNPDLQFSDYPSVWKRLERNIIYAIEYGALFEVNAAAFKKKWGSAYPAKDVAEASFFPELEYVHIMTPNMSSSS